MGIIMCTLYKSISLYYNDPFTWLLGFHGIMAMYKNVKYVPSDLISRTIILLLGLVRILLH